LQGLVGCLHDLNGWIGEWRSAVGAVCSGTRLVARPSWHLLLTATHSTASRMSSCHGSDIPFAPRPPLHASPSRALWGLWGRRWWGLPPSGCLGSRGCWALLALSQVRGLQPQAVVGTCLGAVGRIVIPCAADGRAPGSLLAGLMTGHQQQSTFGLALMVLNFISFPPAAGSAR
jgi:hypothetical protein